jgi:glutathione-regulated potassium-efflux system ancillary protein KefC
MTAVWTLFTLWAGLALIAGLLSVWLRVSTVLTEIIVGTAAQAIMGTFFGAAVLDSDEGWIKFFAGIGAIMLTFLAGAELDPIVFKKKWKEATALGVVGFVFPFLGCAAAAFFVLGWSRGRVGSPRLLGDFRLAELRAPPKPSSPPSIMAYSASPGPSAQDALQL